MLTISFSASSRLVISHSSKQEKNKPFICLSHCSPSFQLRAAEPILNLIFFPVSRL